MRNTILMLLSCISVLCNAQNTKGSKTQAPSSSDIQKMMDDAMKNLSPEEQQIAKDMLGDKLTTITQNMQNPNADKAYYDYLLNEGKRNSYIGTKTKTIIGKAGGKITSSSGKFSFEFPPDALQDETELTLEEIANNRTMACGNACRLFPQNIILSKPANLTVKYADDEINGTAPEMLSIYNLKGKTTPVVLDKVNKTVKTKITNTGGKFMPESNLRLNIVPSKVEIASGQTIEIKIIDQYYKDKSTKDTEDDLIPLTPAISGSPFDDALDAYNIIEWNLNNIKAPTIPATKYGSLLPYQSISTLYTAPEVIPLSERQVFVKVILQHKKTKAQITLISTIFLLTNDYFNISLNNNRINALGLLDPLILEKFKQNKISTWIPSGCSYVNDFLLGFGLKDKNSKGFFNFAIKNPHIGKNIIVYSDEGDKGTFGAYFEDMLYGLQRNIYTKDENGCHREEPTYKTLTIYIDTLINKTGGKIVGHFDDAIYDDGEEDKCKTSEEHHLKGNFSLTIVNFPFSISNGTTPVKTTTPTSATPPKPKAPKSEDDDLVPLKSSNDDDLKPLKPSNDDDLKPLKPSPKPKPKPKPKTNNDEIKPFE